MDVEPKQPTTQTPIGKTNEDLYRRLKFLIENKLVSQRFGREIYDHADKKIIKAQPEAYDFTLGLERNLYLQGPPGTGKTYCARCHLWKFFVENYRVGEVTMADLMKTLMNWDKSDHREILLQSRAVLLIDDIDKTAWNPQRLSAFWEFMDVRSSENLRTIFTSNISFDKLQPLMMEFCEKNTSVPNSIIDRMHPIDVVTMKGHSLRKGNADAAS